MKNLKYILILFIICTSCEDVIDVEVPNIAPRFVIDASLNWFDGDSGEYQAIKLSLSAPFFENQVPPATGAIVNVTDNTNTYNFVDSNNDGVYECFNFNPQLNQEYILNITYNEETYIAS
ncbi:MAG: DUF4249 family protein, partial [Lacinutrix sp.]|uniref:DUF4249 family protein n=1 Tax=Lacinutrix sp. TaxID=1937692 RepID=UPI0030B220C7